MTGVFEVCKLFSRYISMLNKVMVVILLIEVIELQVICDCKYVEQITNITCIYI